MPSAPESSDVARAPGPAEVFHRAAEEGRRRLNQSLLELISTGFIAGFTIVFGIAALGIVHAAFEPRFGDVARIAGALAFGGGLVMLIVGRSELFTENFFDPVAAAVERSDSWMLAPLVRLWTLTIAFNLVGGALLVILLSVDGVLPPGSGAALSGTAEEIADRRVPVVFADAVAGGVLVALLSHLLVAVDSTGSRIAVTYLVGFLLALGPFDHVVVTVLHLFFGVRFGAEIAAGTVTATAMISTAGNFVGGLGLVTFSHAAQTAGARRSED